MELVVLPSPEAACQAVANTVAAQLADRPDSVFGLAAGSTFQPVYAELVRRHQEGELSFARATAFSLDEYVGLPPDHPASLRRQLEDALYAHVDLPSARTHAPEVADPDLAAACARYESAIATAGGFDLVLLGIGVNGHIAFNEPPAPFDSSTRVVTLAAETRAANQLAFGRTRVPEQAMTIGIGTILSARCCLLLAHGGHKARALARAIEGPATTLVPASALKRHTHAIVVIDEEAAGALSSGWLRDR